MNLDLKDDATPMCLRPYPIPRVHDAMIRKEVKRILKVGVLGESNESEWVAPSIDQPKLKNKCVIFLSDFRKLSRQLKRKPYPMSKIREMLLNLEGSQYATSLNLNMVYYHIRLINKAINLSNVILPCGK